MPVAAQVGRVEGHDDEVPGAGRDVLVAARAEVGLLRLVRLDAPDLYLGIRAHASRSATTTNAATTNT